jgi:hypothetical protein
MYINARPNRARGARAHTQNPFELLPFSPKFFVFFLPPNASLLLLLLLLPP